MAREARVPTGPVKAWVEPDRWAYARAFPIKTSLFLLSALVLAVLAFVIHPVFWVGSIFALFRHAVAEAALRELWREGMLHPARVLEASPGLWATLVRLESERGIQDAVVVSRMPRRYQGGRTPWGSERVAVIITGQPPRLRPLSVDLANGDAERAKRATDRIPSVQWDALTRALEQLKGPLTLGIHPVDLGEEPWYGTLRVVEDQGSIPEYVSDSKNTSWCAGLPLVEEPDMVIRERERVRVLRRLALRRFVLFALLALISPILFVFIAALGFEEAKRGAMPAVIGVLGLACFIASPLFAISALQSVRMARLLSAELVPQKLLRFLGTVSSFDSLGLDPDLAQLTRRGLFFADPSAEQDLLVLPKSQQVLHVNGKWAPLGLRVHIEHVAPPPASPIKVPLPEDVQAEESEGVSVARRRLTDLEVEELLRHATVLRRPGRIFWILTIIAAIALSSWHVQAWRFPPQPMSILIGLIGWAFGAVALLRRLRLSSQLRNDAELGWVVTVDGRHGRHADADELPARGVETLLHAHMDWTVNRRPATWRRFAGRTPT